MRSDLSKTAELTRTVLNNIHVEQMLKIVFKRGGVGAGVGGGGGAPAVPLFALAATIQQHVFGVA